MKPETPDDVLDLLDASFVSAAVGAAMELGLFWLLEAGPLDLEGVARAVGIPPLRCAYWLQLLCDTGLIERVPHGFQLSQTARRSILDVYSRDSWALLAEEARGRMPGLRDLPHHLRDASSAWEALGLTPSMAYARMAEDSVKARRATRMLCELHRPLADEVAGVLDLAGVDRLMDLGGGSGVVSLALARRHPALSVTVVDLASVCAAGQEITAESSLEKRITFHPADFLRDELPIGFDMVLECDVNVYGVGLFRNVRNSLNPGGRFVLVDQFAPAEGVAPSSRVHWAFEGSMINPGFLYPTAAQIGDMLERAGFRLLFESPLCMAAGACARFAEGWVLIEARP
jgi:cyclopropane fatty-acyl-phospholipid synthase-like methyltransferase